MSLRRTPLSTIAAASLLTALAIAPAAAQTPEAVRVVASHTHGFQLEVPPSGTLADPTGTWPWPQGPCGTSVRELPADPFGNASAGVVIDNFVFVEVIEWPGTAREWLVDETLRALRSAHEWARATSASGPGTAPDRAQAAGEMESLYSYEPIITNADEALVPVPRAGAEWSGGFEGPTPKPLGGVLAVYRKGTRLFVVRPLQNPGQLNACVAESAAQLRRIGVSLTFVGAEAGQVASQD